MDTVRFRLARRAVVWVAGAIGSPRTERPSPGVARQHSGALGKVGNCQTGVSIHAASDAASCPLSRRLFLPSRVGRHRSRRTRCRISEEGRHRPGWQLALNMLDELAAVAQRRRSRTPASGRRRLPPRPRKPPAWPTPCRSRVR
ncbi:transposase [Streptomyces sp. NPDC005566]|uniref:transposase n=1 Tax=Streptomyces sp. NPDC005566 TaxID=3156886 RepID=UPI0033BC8FF4